MATLRRLRIDSRRGRRAFLDWQRRGESALDAKTRKRARKIVEAVRRGGDAALLRACARYDDRRVGRVSQLRLRPGIEALEKAALPEGFEVAVERSIAAVEAYHRLQIHQGFTVEEHGIRLEERRVPLKRVGLYVPGGRFPYPSTVIMSVVPARLAGVKEIVVVTPPASFEKSPALRYTLDRLEVEEIWGMGGAHAVAALAYGTESVGRVDLIAGPGNVWVAAAKQLVRSDVGVDRDAGPSEVVIVADRTADATAVAVDLLAQAEHDPDAAVALVTPDRQLAKAVSAEVDRLLPSLETAETAAASLESRGCAFLVADLEAAFRLAEQLAPEHLQLMGDEAELLEGRVKRAGAVFVGASTPVVLGDYVAGPSHVLPTGGSARFSSGLSTEDFTRRLHVVRFEPQAVAQKAHDAAVLAQVEGLVAHAASARLRAGEANPARVEERGSIDPGSEESPPAADKDGDDDVAQ